MILTSTSKLDEILSKLDEEKLKNLEALLSKVEVANQLLDRLDSMQQSGALDSLTNAAYAIKTFQDALHEDTVASGAAMVGSMLELGKAVSSPETKTKLVELIDKGKLESVTYLLGKLEEMKQNATLDALIDAAYLVKTLRDMLTEDSVTNLATRLAVIELLPAAPELTAALSSRATGAMLTAMSSPDVKKAAEDPPKVGYRGLISALRDEDMQRGMGFLLLLAKAMGRSLKPASDTSKDV